MSDTKIEWTEKSWNPIVGCSLASPGCTNCYAMKMAGRVEATGHEVYQGLTQRAKSGFVWTGKLAFNEKALLEPLKRKKPTTYFVNSMGDLFHEDCPDEWINRVFAVMALCPQHTFQVLTKRSGRMREYLTREWLDEDGFYIDRKQCCLSDACSFARRRGLKQDRDADWPLSNVWLGVSVEDQRRADERVSDLLATPAAVRWLSCEPLIGAVDLQHVEYYPGFLLDGLTGLEQGGHAPDLPPLDWVVCGGESGSGSRPMHPAWARSLRDQCAVAGVPFFFKQHGDWIGLGVRQGDDRSNIEGMWPVDTGGMIRLCSDGSRASGGYPMQRVGKRCAGRVLDGVVHDAMPQVAS